MLARSAGRSPPGRPCAGRHACRPRRSPPRCRSSRCSGTSAASTDRPDRCVSPNVSALPMRVQESAAMVVDDALGIAGGARGVAERRSPPTRRPAAPRRRSGSPCCEQGLVVDDAERARRRAAGSTMSITTARRCTCASAAATTGAHSLSASSTLASPCSRMKAIEAASRRIVERVEHGARHRHAVMRLQHRRRVGAQHRHRVAAPDTQAAQRAGEPAAAPADFAPGQ